MKLESYSVGFRNYKPMDSIIDKKTMNIIVDITFEGDEDAQSAGKELEDSIFNFIADKVNI